MSSVVLAENRGDFMSTTRPIVAVRFTLHGGKVAWFEDYIDSNGRFVPQGTQIVTALKRHEQINTTTLDGDEKKVEIIIPYHAVDTYEVTKREEDYTEPEDAFCTERVCPTSPKCDDGGGERTWTISANDGIYDQQEAKVAFETMIPYFLENDIPVSFMGSAVTSITYDEENGVGATIVTADGTHTINLPMSGDYEYLELWVDDEQVETASFTFGTNKYFIAWQSLDGGNLVFLHGELVAPGVQPVYVTEPDEYEVYWVYSPQKYIGDYTNVPIPEDFKYPMFDADTMFTVGA